jgi:hypothetical protein
MNRLQRHYEALLKAAGALVEGYRERLAEEATGIFIPELPLSKHVRFWYQKTFVPNNRPAGRYHNEAGEKMAARVYYTGLTVCVVWLGGKDYLIGYCNLHHKDKFHKAKGRAIALGRALKQTQQVQNIPNTLYRLGAPWQLYYANRPKRWPEQELVLTTPLASPEERRRHKPDSESGFKVEEALQ